MGGTDEYETRARVIGPEMNLASFEVKSVIAARGNPQFASGLHERRSAPTLLYSTLEPRLCGLGLRGLGMTDPQK